VSRSDRKGRLSLRRVDALAAGVCLAAALPLCFASVNPLLRSGDDASQRKAQLATLRRQAGRADQSLVAQRKRLEALRAEVDKHTSRSLSAGNLNRRIAKLTELAVTTGLEVDEILPGVPARTGRARAVPVKLTASGSYPTCVVFLANLSKAFPDTSVGSFELTGYPQHPARPAKLQVDLRWHLAAAPEPQK